MHFSQLSDDGVDFLMNMALDQNDEVFLTEVAVPLPMKKVNSNKNSFKRDSNFGSTFKYSDDKGLERRFTTGSPLYYNDPNKLWDDSNNEMKKQERSNSKQKQTKTDIANNLEGNFIVRNSVFSYLQYQLIQKYPWECYNP